MTPMLLAIGAVVFMALFMLSMIIDTIHKDLKFFIEVGKTKKKTELEEEQ